MISEANHESTSLSSSKWTLSDSLRGFLSQVVGQLLDSTPDKERVKNFITDRAARGLRSLGVAQVTETTSLHYAA